MKRNGIDEAINTGDVGLLYQSIKDNPEILDGFSNRTNTPLHEAAKLGHTKFCAEMMNLMPSFGKKLNYPEGLTPLHLALQYRHKHAALALLAIDRELVRVKGKDGMTPLMYCAKSTDDIYLEILAKFLRDCPQSIYDKNTRSQTALHVALESNNCKGVAILLNWIQRSSNENVLRIKDDQGNRPLHVAAQHKCEEGVKIMVEIALLNKRNDNGETPFDIANKVGHPGIIKLFKKKKALTSRIMLPKSTSTYADFLKAPVSRSENAMKSYKYMMKDLNTDMRNVVLVVAVLIATATYTALLQPPGGVYQANATDDNKYSTIGRGSLQIAASVPPPPPPQREGRMLMHDGEYKRFVPTNTAAFTLSIMVIIFVLPGRPYTIILHTCLIFLSYSCLIGMVFVSNETGISNAIFFVSWSLIAFTFFVKIVYFLFVEGLIKDMSWITKSGEDTGTINQCFQLHNSLIYKLRQQYKLTERSLQLNKP